MKIRPSFRLFCVAALICPSVIEAGTVKILTSNLVGMISGGDGDDDLNAFYQGQGISSSLFTGSVTATEISGASLFVVMLPDDAFSASEITVMSDYLSSGGRLLFMGEQEAFAGTQNVFLNSALEDLGSTMSIGEQALDTGFNNTIVGQIDPHPLTVGVSLINYGNVNEIGAVPSGGELFFTKDLTSLWGGVESVGGGTIVLLGDTNMLSNIENTSTNDNGQFFVNVVPEPSSPALMMVAASFVFRRRR